MRAFRVCEEACMSNLRVYYVCRINGLQKLNHFPAMSDLARKDFLANNLNQ
jgi:hypothetical protein